MNRLKVHLSNVISENQNAFIPGRMISDNIVIAHEILHSLKARKRQATSYMAVKTDITKAYDRLEWSFLAETMRVMGFDQKWIGWIMACVSSVRFSVLIAGRLYYSRERITARRSIVSILVYLMCRGPVSLNATSDARQIIDGCEDLKQCTSSESFALRR